ncbi:Semaphorin-4B [Bagarius yarrelli]|uniref:Semaphorin-4B n=1 Tax=Bagarius yarrelli TaxID=175774 RepID=A0A556TP67_BAGYA|nr:Semaphorin-4B [Bagarius yarrelli]
MNTTSRLPVTDDMTALTSWSPGRPFTLFTLPDVYNTTTLLLSDDEETLYLGARDALLSLNISNEGHLQLIKKIDWSPTDGDVTDCSMKGTDKMNCPNFVRVLQVLNSTHMFACGTFAFSPRCIFISSESFSPVTNPSAKTEEGRGRCPYNPYDRKHGHHCGGNRPVISRHLSEGDRVDMKLDDKPGWLEDPTFISSTYIPTEEKVYFFFSEMGREYDFIDKFTVSRIAQVCTSDVGGQRTLQRRWTTFTKAQLLCQTTGELPYNVLQDMTTLRPPEGASEDDTLFYGIFSSQWSVNSGRSAVCVFNLRAVKAVFAGKYKVLNRDTLKWSSQLQEKIANPGECGLHNASDNALRFVKENFLADKSVAPANQGLTLVSHDQRYSNIVAQRVTGAHGKEYTVLFLLTESGYLQKAVLVEGGAHIIEEIQVMKPQRVTNLLLSASKGVVFVGSSEGVASVPVSNCAHYRSCADWRRCTGHDPVAKSPQNIYIQEKGGSISFLATPTTLGTYVCQATENGFTQTLAVYEVRQDDDPAFQALTTPTAPVPDSRPEATSPLLKLEPKSQRPVENTVVQVSGHAPDDGSVNMLQRESRACYLKELVAVSVLLVMCVCVLLLVAAYNLRKSYRSRTAPHSPSLHRRPGSSEGASEQETKALKGNSPQVPKHNGQKTPNKGVSSGSNGHLPNIPI